MGTDFGLEFNQTTNLIGLAILLVLFFSFLSGNFLVLLPYLSIFLGLLGYYFSYNGWKNGYIQREWNPVRYSSKTLKRLFPDFITGSEASFTILIVLLFRLCV